MVCLVLWWMLDTQPARQRGILNAPHYLCWCVALPARTPLPHLPMQITMVGTPLTHERYLRRARGTYGPAIKAGQGLFPGPSTPVAGLFCCGDSRFPGARSRRQVLSLTICSSRTSPSQLTDAPFWLRVPCCTMVPDTSTGPRLTGHSLTEQASGCQLLQRAEQSAPTPLCLCGTM